MDLMKRFLPGALCATAVLALGFFALQPDVVEAADHTDPPDRVDAGDAADIGDIYSWHDADGMLTVVLTFAGPVAPSADQTGTYDEDVLYAVHIDNSGDNVANFDIFVKFGQNDLGDWGVQVQGLPGSTGPIVGPVESEISDANTKVWVGLRDDPFFMDLQGFLDTTSTGTLSFDPTRDFFAGLNITALVLEMPLSAAQGGGTDLQVWATTASL